MTLSQWTTTDIKQNVSYERNRVMVRGSLHGNMKVLTCDFRRNDLNIGRLSRWSVHCCIIGNEFMEFDVECCMLF